jgi:hypothetical protein
MCILHDEPGNILEPHTDTPEKFVTGLFYLPDDDADRRYGTELYISKSGKTCEGYVNHPFSDDFVKVGLAEYLPNTAFFFHVTPSSWHTAPETKARRWLLDYSLKP